MPLYGPSQASSSITLLGAKLYDPASLVTKSTASNLAMTALDTTNLRITFTAPDNGAVRLVLKCAMHGSGIATTLPIINLGALSGASVAARMWAHFSSFSPNSSNAYGTYLVDMVVPDLTPGAALTWDAAYGVEVAGTNTSIKYGGPNDTSGANAFGAFSYEIWTTG